MQQQKTALLEHVAVQDRTIHSLTSELYRWQAKAVAAKSQAALPQPHSQGPVPGDGTGATATSQVSQTLDKEF